MIEKIIIKDNSKSPLNYISDIKALANGKEYNFKKGVNIIIGPNGCGKSTLLELASCYLWVHDQMQSKVSNSINEYPNLFDRFGFTDDMKFNDGIIVKHDYQTKAFRLRPKSDFKAEECFKSRESFGLFGNSVSSSVGEQTILSVSSLFDVMFNKTKDYSFPIKKIKELAEQSNDVWKSNYNRLLKYYKNNRISCSQDDYEFTVLMDEPDRNLDIDNLQQVYGILSERKEHTQIIAIVHNPILIYKLSKLKDINFIQMERGYLNKIKNLINK